MAQTVVIGGKADDNLEDNWTSSYSYEQGGSGGNQQLSSSPYTDISQITNSEGQLVNYILGDNSQGLTNLGIQLGQSFNGLFDLIRENSEYNNQWSAKQASIQRDWQEIQNQKAMDFNAAEAAKNRDWQEMMSNTAHQREIADLQAAGLNPVLSASGGNGASVTSGATASGVTSSGAKGDTDTSTNQALASLYNGIINAQTSMYNANLSAKTNLEIADKQMQASMYAARLAAETARYSNPYQIVTSLVNDVLGDDRDDRSSGYKNIIESPYGIVGTTRTVIGAAKKLAGLVGRSGPSGHSQSKR